MDTTRFDGPGSTDESTDELERIRTVLEAARQLHGSLDVSSTLAGIAKGVLLSCGFGVACLNLVQADGSYRTVAVEGNDAAREALLGRSGSAEAFTALMTKSRDWDGLRFVHHDDPLGSDDSFPFWRPDIEAGDDPTRWHPDDMLFAPLTSQSGDVIGVLAVDLPHTGLMPDEHQRQLLLLFAQHAALAIENARLHAETAEQRDQLHWQARHDPLTALANRGALNDDGGRLAAEPGTEVAVLVVDLDEFKAVNDDAGHHHGDAVLTAVARRLQRCVRDSDVVARSGGDEFVIVTAGVDLLEPTRRLAERLTERLSEPYEFLGRTHRVGVSVGFAVARTPVDFAEILVRADADMYRVKRGRRISPVRPLSPA